MTLDQIAWVVGWGIVGAVGAGVLVVLLLALAVARDIWRHGRHR